MAQSLEPVGVAYDGNSWLEVQGDCATSSTSFKAQAAAPLDSH